MAATDASLLTIEHVIEECVKMNKVALVINKACLLTESLDCHLQS